MIRVGLLRVTCLSVHEHSFDFLRVGALYTHFIFVLVFSSPIFHLFGCFTFGFIIVIISAAASAVYVISVIEGRVRSHLEMTKYFCSDGFHSAVKICP